LLILGVFLSRKWGIPLLLNFGCTAILRSATPSPRRKQMALVPADVSTALPAQALEMRLNSAESKVRPDLLTRYRKVRAFSQELCEPLETEDFVVQTMPEVSPTKWHLLHTTWFFETFVLAPTLKNYHVFQPDYAFLFNSYYNGVGPQYPRPRRGLLSRPTVAETHEYRQYVDKHMVRLLEALPARDGALRDKIVLGIQHEQQHQELMVTDFKHVLCTNPLRPVYRPRQAPGRGEGREMQWLPQEGGLKWIGFEGDGFSYDNEGGRHQQYLEPFALGSRLVSNGDYLEFMRDGGYDKHGPWLSEGWALVQAEQWRAPLYWEERDGEWHQATLSGVRPVALEEPVCHVSQYEADAFARWAGARLPSEAEWEVVAGGQPVEGNFVESRRFHPEPAGVGEGAVAQVYGDVWEWTRSPYTAYPGYAPAEGALGEYNGKFMSNQMVLRGGSCATSITHIRPTYRNFFPPAARWQFTGFRLAKEA